MEFKEAIGSRRSIRFWLPWRPVEPEKLQVILESIRRAPRLLEVDFLKAVVLHRDQLSAEDLEAMKGPTTTTQIELCPTYIFIYADLAALERATDGATLEQMIDAGALNESHGWTRERLRSTLLPDSYQAVVDEEDRVAVRFRTPDGMREGPSFSRSTMVLARHQIGIAHAYALLTAVEVGLGAQLSAVGADVPKRVMGIPDEWISSSPILIGYAAEDLQAGGQRPREPFEQDFFDGRYGAPFHRSAAVVERLEAEKMIQPQAPLPWRRDELRRLARMFGLPE